MNKSKKTVESYVRKPMVHIFSNAQSLSKLKTLKDQFTKTFKVHQDDVIVFMNLAVPYFQELTFFRKLKCKKYIVHRAGYYRQNFKFNKFFGFDELESERKFFNGRFGIHYEWGMEPRLEDLNSGKNVENVNWDFLTKYPSEHTPTTGFIVYFLVKQFFPNHQINLINFDGKESNQKFGHKWSFEIQYFNNVDIGHKIELSRNTNVVELCYITDASYAKLTQLSIFSAISTKSENTILNVHVICDKVSDSDKRDFERLSCKNVIVKTYDVDSDRFVKDGKQLKHCSKTMYMKIFIPSILGDLDKVLYMDGDVLVRKDLTEYFSQLDVKDNYDMAVIKDLGVIKIWPDSFKLYQIDDVFYSGQMILNLKRLRGENGIENRYKTLLELGRYNIDNGDEPIINILEFNRVKYLDPKYCLSWHKIVMNIHPEVYNNIDVYNQVYNTKYTSMSELVEASVVWHFHGDKKQIFKHQKIRMLIDAMERQLEEFKTTKKVNTNNVNRCIGQIMNTVDLDMKVGKTKPVSAGQTNLKRNSFRQFQFG